jgi:diguanylate cyclase (GGDEF)-like protein/PAS domain S-box-containing protein
MTVEAKRWGVAGYARAIAIAATGWAAVYPILLANATAASHSGSRPLVAAIAFPPMNLATCLMAWFAASRVADERLRRAFRWIGFAWVAILAGNACTFLYANVLHLGDYTVAWWVNLPFFLFYPLLVIGLLSLPMADRAHNERRKFLYDSLTVLLGGGIAIWHMVVVPTAMETRAGLVGQVIALLYPLGDILVLAGLTTVLLRRLPERGSTASRVFVGGVILYTLSDLANDLVLQQVGPFRIAWTDFTFMFAYALLLWGCYHTAMSPDAMVPPATAGGEATTAPAGDRDADIQPFSPLPYASLALLSVLLLRDALATMPNHWSLLAIGEVALTLLVVTRQITAVRENVRLVAERATRRNEARFRSLVQHSSDVIAIVEAGGIVRYVTPSVTRVLGYTTEQIEGRPLTALLHPDDVGRGEAMFAEAVLRPGVTAPTEWRVRHRDGRWMYVEAVGTNLVHEPTVRGVVVNTRDITERKSLEAQLVHQAFHDPLTGLANRALFLDRVTHALAITGRYGIGPAILGRHPVAVMFLDLDNFKTLNDSFGHVPADQLLAAVARRLCDAVRTSDTVARLGGDEFAILIEDASGPMAPATAAERITVALTDAFMIDGKEVYATASIGIAIATPDLTPSDLLRNADTAMYQAKARGKARYEVFEASMHAETLARVELETDLRRAVERGEFSLRYQPIVDLRTSAITGVEALVRWEHPRRGTLAPAQFIGLAEETGLIVPIGRWVIREACRQARRWQQRHPREVPLTLSMNVSGNQLAHSSLVESIRSALAEYHLDPSTIVLEITESVLMQQMSVMLTYLEELKTLRVRLAIDDFGTGYSSLSYLKRFPIDVLKIGKPFVDDVGDAVTDTAIIGLGSTLRLQTIAEGIEAAGQLHQLRSLGCELGQGNYFSEPLTSDALDALLGSARPIALHAAL